MLKATPADNEWIFFSNAPHWTWRRRYFVPFAPSWIDLLRFTGLHQRSSGPAIEVMCGLLKVILAILKFFALTSLAPLPIPCPIVVLAFHTLFCSLLCQAKPTTFTACNATSSGGIKCCCRKQWFQNRLHKTRASHLLDHTTEIVFSRWNFDKHLWNV